MSMSSASDGHVDDLMRGSLGAGAGGVTLAAARAEGRFERVRRRQQQGVGSGAVAVGDDQRRARADMTAQQSLELVGIEQRTIARHQEDPTRA